jgi:hypothetical protein
MTIDTTFNTKYFDELTIRGYARRCNIFVSSRRMKAAIRQWMGGQDYHVPGEPCSSWKGVLSICGIPTAFCYYSYVTGRRHQIVAPHADKKLDRFLKNRDVFEHPDIMAVIATMTANPRALSPVGTDALVIRHINATNKMCAAIGAPHPYRAGSEFIADNRTATREPWQDETFTTEQNELSCILFRLQREVTQPFPYLVKAQHATDITTLRTTVGWRDLGSNWYGTRDLMEFTLFKIGRIKSLPFEITYS